MLVDHRQHPERLAVMGAIRDEVVAPDMTAILRTQSHARSVVQPSAELRLLLWYFEPLATPDTFNPLGIRRPAFTLQQRRDPPIAIATIGRCQPDDIRRQTLLIGSWSCRTALGRTVLANCSACTTLGYTERRTRMNNASTTARGAQYFPSITSFRIKASSVRFDTAFLSRAFSFSSDFKRAAYVTFRPPYSRRHR